MIFVIPLSNTQWFKQAQSVRVFDGYFDGFFFYGNIYNTNLVICVSDTGRRLEEVDDGGDQLGPRGHRAGAPQGAQGLLLRGVRLYALPGQG